jgi:hypothetical protein
MADYGGADRVRVIEGIVGDLEAVYTHGAEAWRSSGGAGSLAAIEKLPQVERATEAGKSQSEAVWEVVREACESLLDKYVNPALAYFGYQCTVTEADGKVTITEPGTSYTGRTKIAADFIPIAPRWFGEFVKKGRSYKGQRHESYELLILDVVAQELAANAERDQPTPPSLTNLAPIKDVHDHYRQTPPTDLQQYGFFERSSTTGYIEDIAQLAEGEVPITIYAGISAYAGNEPQRRQFMERLLSQQLQKSHLLREASNDEERKAIAERMSQTIAQAYVPYLGSIIRELKRRGTNDHPPTEEELRTIEQSLRFEMTTLLATGAVPGRFVATAIATCAFAMRRTGAAVNVITSSYNDVLVKEAAHIDLPSYLPVKDYKFVTPTRGKDNPEAVDDNLGPTEVGITQVNGSLESDTPLILGEGDFFAEYGADLRPTKEHSSWRHDLLTRLLEQTACIFVGSTLTDPDVLEHLARTKHRHRRYALLLQPTFDSSGKDTAPVGSLEHYVGRELIAQRYLHLGVVPIIVEHPHQIPQLLREVALKILQGDNYKSYSARTKYWWDYWAKAFGHKPANGPAGPRSVSLQEHWRAKPLTEARKHIEKVIDADNRPKLDEQILLEVWLRNPYERNLVLWAGSDSHLLNASTAHRGSLRGHGGGYIVQKVFQQGRSEYKAVPPQRGQWRYAWAIPLVLSREPWCSLPVGVLNIMSNQAEDERDSKKNVIKIAGLRNITDLERRSRETVEKLEKNLKKIILRELDPQSTTWRREKELPDWDAYSKPPRRKRR